jgi:RNase P/RNase MRP subunit p29
MKKIFSKYAKHGLVVFLMLVSLFFVFRYFRTNKELAIGINPPSSKFDIPYEEFTINNDSAATINTKSGSVYSFTKNSLVFSSGDAVHGLVKVRIREFHDAIDIMRAGIPMRSRRNKNSFLESSGMVEIKAYKDSTELKLADNSSLKTDLAAYRGSKNYQLFFLKDNNDWQTRDTFETKPNLLKQEKLKKLQDDLNRLNKDGLLTDIDFEFYSDIDVAPDMKRWLGKKWRIKKEDVTDEVKNSLRVNWDSVYIRPVNKTNLEFELRFTKHQYKTTGGELISRFNVRAYAIKDGATASDLGKDYDNRMAIVDSIKKDLEFEIARVQKEADFLNSFNMKQLGIWNIDRLSKESEMIQVSAKFDYQSTLNGSENIRVFCLYEETNSTLEFNNRLGESIYLRKDKPMRIVAFLSDSQVAIVDFDQIKNQLANKPKEVFFNTRKVSTEDFLSEYKTSNP